MARLTSSEPLGKPGETCESMLESRLQALEARFGRLPVQYTVSLLALACEGLEENDLEDILSCNDDILNALFEVRSRLA
jgi:hypothetical protein